MNKYDITLTVLGVKADTKIEAIDKITENLRSVCNDCINIKLEDAFDENDNSIAFD